jgi:hypothetical protein
MVASGKEYIMIHLVNDVEGNFRVPHKLGIGEGKEREKYFLWMRFMSQEIDSFGNFFPCSPLALMVLKPLENQGRKLFSSLMLCRTPYCLSQCIACRYIFLFPFLAHKTKL